MCIFAAAGAAAGTALIATSWSAPVALLANVAVASIPTAISTGVTIAGQMQQADAAKAQGKYEAKIARYEAVLADQAGMVEQFKFGVQAQREFGRMMVAQAASAKDISIGNSARQQVEARKFQTFDSDIITRNVKARVLSLEMSAQNSILRGRNQAVGFQYGAAAAGVGGIGGIVDSFTSVGYAMGGFGKASTANTSAFAPEFDPSLDWSNPFGRSGWGGPPNYVMKR